MIHKKRDEWSYTLCGKKVAGLLVSNFDDLIDCTVCRVYLTEDEIAFLADELIEDEKEKAILSRLLFGLFCGALALSVLLFLLSFEV